MIQTIKETDGLERIAHFLTENDGYILICHISPDGDTIGSALALYNTLKVYGKKVQICCYDRVPYSLLFLPGANEILHPDKTVTDETAIAVDCADLGRLGKCQRLFDAAKYTISIDHHGTNTMFAMQNEVFPKCAATAEIMYELIRIFAGTISQEVANCLYTGLMTDTGGFSFSNVTAQTFAIASELVRFGANPWKANQNVYRTVPLAKSRLLGFALSSSILYHEGQTVLSVITQADMARVKAKADDSEGIIDHLRDIEGVEVAIVLRECLDGEYKISMRSKDYIDVALICNNFGGGGHERAAGAKSSMQLDKLTDLVLSAVKEAYEEADY